MFGNKFPSQVHLHVIIRRESKQEGLKFDIQTTFYPSDTTHRLWYVISFNPYHQKETVLVWSTQRIVLALGFS